MEWGNGSCQRVFLLEKEPKGVRMKLLTHNFALLARILIGMALAVTAIPAIGESSGLTFEIAGMSCETSCAPEAKKALEKIPGVTRASVDFSKSEGRIEANRKIAPEEIRKALAALGFEARFAGDKRVEPLTAEERARADIRTVSTGEEVEIRKHLASDKITIFDFWAEWCGPCHVLTPKIERLALENGLAVRKIDISDWDSSAARQATREFAMPALPYVRIYGPDGKFLGAVAGNDINEIRKIVGSNS